MLGGTLMQVLAHPADGVVAIVTQGPDSPHVVNTWNSYVQVTQEDKLLIPAGRMYKTEENIGNDNRVRLTVGSREVQGKSYKGTGFLITGVASFVNVGPDYDVVKEKFKFARAALVITVLTVEQTL